MTDTFQSRFYFESDQKSLADEVEPLQMSARSQAGYVLHRVLMVNYWRIGYLEMVTPHGRMFLLGENGSGKSTILGALVPVLLDGNIRPERFDSFKTTQRQIDYYVLEGRDQRTSYVAAEFIWSDGAAPGNNGAFKPRYLTIGICFVGNKNAQEAVKAYRFVITDGTRLGYDIPLVIENDSNHNGSQTNEKRVRDAQSFRSEVREHGVITERQHEYSELVGRHLFGFNDPLLLERMIDVLLRLRQPNLNSENSAFVEVYECLKRALPALPEELTTTITETFNRMDDLRHQADRWLAQANACAELQESDVSLARAKAAGKAQTVLDIEAEAELCRQKVDEKGAALANARRILEGEQARYEHLEGEIKTGEDGVGALEQSPQAQEADALESQLRMAQDLEREARENLAQRVEAVLHNKQTVGELDSGVQKRTANWLRQCEKSGQTLAKLMNLARQGSWPEGAAAVASSRTTLDDWSVDREEAPDLPSIDATLRPLVDRRMRQVQDMADRHQAYANLCREHAQAVSHQERAVGEVRRSGERLEEAKGALAAHWREIDEKLPLRQPSQAMLEDTAPDATAALVTAIGETSVERLKSTIARIDAAVQEKRSDTMEKLRLHGHQIGQLAQRRTGLAERIAALASEPDITPARRPHREQARAALKAAGIDARPLYALVDFAPSLDSVRRGQIERALDDAGLLDALVIRPEEVEAAETFLAEEGFSDCRIAAAFESFAAHLGSFLQVDSTVDAPDWQEAARLALASVGVQAKDRETAIIGTDGFWRHGLLVGHSAEGDPLGFIGAANRQAARQRQLAELARERDDLSLDLVELEAEVTRLEDWLGQLDAAYRDLLSAVDYQKVVAAEATAQERQASLAAVEESAREAALEADRLAGECAGTERSLGEDMAILGVTAPDAALVARALEAMRGMEGTCGLVQSELERLVELWSDRRSEISRLARALETLEAAKTAEKVARQHLAEVETKVQAIRETLLVGTVADFRERLMAARQRVKDLRNALSIRMKTLQAAIGVEATIASELASASAGAAQAEERLGAAVRAFVDILRLNPDVAGAPPSENVGGPQGAAVTLARSLFPAGRPGVEALAQALSNAIRNRQAVFDEHRMQLAEYDIVITGEPRDRVVVRVSDQMEKTLADLLSDIERHMQETQMLLTIEEERLFKEYLCDKGFRTIHKAVQAAYRFRDEMNDVLQQIPLGREYYRLHFDRKTEPGSSVNSMANHHDLFRKDPATITDGERKVLLEAVRGAIDEAHRLAREGDGIFADLLNSAFDYREWFTLGLSVKDVSGQEMRLNARKVRQRSGGQQLFALYLPLFAALAALYRSAAPWAPRLFAMDEAFDKVSDDNISLLLRFMVDLEFQWILASPRLMGAGRAEVPSCADWRVIHNVERRSAYARPVIRGLKNSARASG